MDDRTPRSRGATVVRIELFEAKVPLSAIARGAMAQSDNGLGM